MKAALLFGKNDIRVVDRPIPAISADEVLLRVRAAAICGTDVRFYRNGLDGVDEQHPLVLGHEVSGVIEKVGENVRSYHPGQRVAVAPNMGCGICPDCIRGNSHMCRDYKALGINLDGGFAEYVKIPEKAVKSGNIMLLEDHVSYSEAAVLEALSCVFNGSEQSRITPGDIVLIIGAGPIGIMHAMLAKLRGAGKVLINDVSAERLSIVQSIDPFFKTIHERLKEAVDRESHSRGADVVITACPVPSAQQEAIDLAANYGRVCLFGGLPHDKRMVPFDANQIHYKQLIVTGTTRASLRHYQRALELLSAGILPIHQVITTEFQLADIQEGFNASISARGLKNVIVMGDVP